MTLILEMGILLGLIGVAFKLNGQHFRATNTLILGSGSKAAKLLREIESQTNISGHKVLGFITTGESRNHIPAEYAIQSEEKLIHLATNMKAKAIVVAIDKEEMKDWTQQLLDCKLSGVTLLDPSALESSQKSRINPFQDKGRVLQIPLVR